MSGELISIENVSFRYNSKRLILDNVNAKLNAGKMISLLGPNGAGKSTLLKCIMGLLRPLEGNITIENRRVLDLAYRERATMVAYVPQHSAVVFDHSVRDYVAMGLAARYPMWKAPTLDDMKDVDQYIEEMELTPLANAPFRSLSGGEQQKATIARALVQRPKVLLFDEPTSALDLGNQSKVLRLIKQLSELGYAVLITTHNPEHSLLLEGDVWLLGKDGHLDVGSTDEMITKKRLTELYDTNLFIAHVAEINRKACMIYSI